MKMQFRKWQHPKTGEVRVYVNGEFGFGVKVYVIDGGVTGNYPAGFPEIVVHADYIIDQSTIDAIEGWIDEHVKQSVPSDVNPTFSDYLALAH